MFDRVLIPLDGSSRAELILAQLKPLLKYQGTDVVLLQAIYDPPSLARIDAGKLAREDSAAAEAYLRHIVQRLQIDGIHSRGIVRKGLSEEAVLQAAKEENVDLIAMTTHGRSGMERWMMGSITEKVLRAAEVPLVIIHSFKRTPGGATVPLAGEPVSFKSILVPIDVGDQSLAIVPWVERLAKVYGSEVVLLNVRPEGGDSSSPGPEPSIPLTVKIAQERLSAAGLNVRLLMVGGNPPSVILEKASTGGFDLIAMATHGRSGFRRWVLGSIAERILRSSPIPMFVVPSKEVQPR
jgi:nucleotide-binding universal stress UspA family protein